MPKSSLHPNKVLVTDAWEATADNHHTLLKPMKTITPTIHELTFPTLLPIEIFARGPPIPKRTQQSFPSRVSKCWFFCNPNPSPPHVMSCSFCSLATPCDNQQRSVGDLIAYFSGSPKCVSEVSRYMFRASTQRVSGGRASGFWGKDPATRFAGFPACLGRVGEFPWWVLKFPRSALRTLSASFPAEGGRGGSVYGIPQRLETMDVASFFSLHHYQWWLTKVWQLSIMQNF